MVKLPIEAVDENFQSAISIPAYHGRRLQIHSGHVLPKRRPAHSGFDRPSGIQLQELLAKVVVVPTVEAYLVVVESGARAYRIHYIERRVRILFSGMNIKGEVCLVLWDRFVFRMNALPVRIDIRIVWRFQPEAMARFLAEH